MKRTIVAFILAAFSIAACADLIRVPDHDSGNSSAAAPFGYSGRVRFQQVYSSAAFSAIPIGGTITALALRKECLPGQFCSPQSIESLRIDLSTTQKAVDSLSPVFADNVGPDNTIVFNQAPSFLSPSGLDGFTFPISLMSPFFYDPRQGNLLLDIRLVNGAQQFDLDADNYLGDPVSAAFGVSISGPEPTSGGIGTLGLMTGFVITPVPEPSALSLFAAAAAIAISVGLWRANGKNRETQSIAERNKGIWD